MKNSTLYKLILAIMFIVFSVNSVSAASLKSNSSLVVWSQLENLSDSSGYGNTLTNFGAAADTGCYNNTNCYAFVSAQNDYMSYGDKFEGYNTMTFCAWINSTTTGTNKDILTKANVFVLRKSNGNKIQAFIYDTGYKSSIGTTTILAGTPYWVCGNYDGTNVEVYVNGVQEGTPTAASFIATSTDDALIGNLDGSSTYFDGKIDQVLIFNQSLNDTEHLQLYNFGISAPVSPPGNKTLIFNTVTINNVTITPVSYWNDTTLAFFTNVTNTSTNGNVNQTFFLYNSSNVLVNSTQYATNSLTGNFLTLPLAEDIYKIWFKAENNETSTMTVNRTFYVDTTPPVIQQIANVSENVFVINFSTIINVTDALSGVASCTINITELENVTVPDNFFINCTDTQTFTSAGLHNGFVEAQDNAGNKATYSFNFTINPFVNVRWINNITGANVTNFIAIIYHPDGRIIPQSDTNGTIKLSPVNNGSLDLGNHTLTLVKPGYLKLNYTVNVNESSSGANITFNATPVTLTMRMFDFNNVTDQLNFSVTILNSTDSVVFNNQLTLIKQYNEIPTGDITMVVSSPGYKDATFYNTITQFTSIVVNGFLISNTSASTVTFRVVEFGSDRALEGVIIEAQILVNGSFVTVSQAQTDGTGQTFIQLDINRAYKFVFTKAGYLSNTANSIPGVTNYNVRLRLEQLPFDFLSQISTQLLPVNSILYRGTNYTFSGFISGTGLSLSSLRLVDENNTLVFFDSSINPTGSTFTYNLILPLNSTNLSSITATLRYVRNGKATTVVKKYTITTITNTSIINVMREYDGTDEDSSLMRWFVMVIAIGGSLLAARMVGANTTGSGLIIVMVAGFFTLVNWMPVNYFAAISGAAVFFFIGGRLIR